MTLLLLSAGFLLAWQTLWCAVALWRKRNDIADLAWGLGIASVFAIAAWQLPDNRFMLLAGMAALWGVRLAYHIARRLARTPEDPRYRTWREEWGKRAALRTVFQVFLLQGALQWVVALPAAGAAQSPLSWVDTLGIGVFLFGWLFEAVADAQLATFLRSPRTEGAVLDRGLWRWSRHPNYFGEVVLWWGIGIVAFSGGGAWWALAGPITVTVLLRFVSGVPLAEARSMRREEYRAYAKRTSVFVPLPR